MLMGEFIVIVCVCVFLFFLWSWDFLEFEDFNVLMVWICVFRKMKGEKFEDGNVVMCLGLGFG